MGINIGVVLLRNHPLFSINVSKVTPPAATAAVEPVAIQPIFIHDNIFAICEANIFKGEFITSKILGFFKRRKMVYIIFIILITTVAQAHTMKIDAYKYVEIVTISQNISPAKAPPLREDSPKGNNYKVECNHILL